MLSRLPACGLETADADELSVHRTNLELISITSKQIASLSTKDKTISKAVKYTDTGWPLYLPIDVAQPFQRKGEESTIPESWISIMGKGSSSTTSTQATHT